MKKEFTSDLTCNHCNNTAPMEVVATYSTVRTHSDNNPESPEWDEGDVHELLLCPACKKVILRKYHYHEWFIDDDINELKPQILYPTDHKTPQGLPTNINNAYLAAIKVRSIDTNAYAVLIGRVLDQVCIDRKADGDTLYAKLNDLSVKGEIPKKLVDIAHSLRQLRNVGGHADLGELTTGEIPFLDELCRALLEYVYSAPLLLARAEQRLQAIKSSN